MLNIFCSCIIGGSPEIEPSLFLSKNRRDKFREGGSISRVRKNNRMIEDWIKFKSSKVLIYSKSKKVLKLQQYFLKIEAHTIRI